MKIPVRGGGDKNGKRLLVLGAGLFLLGLVSGLVTSMMVNPRMGLSAHMQGLTNGIFLLAVGAVWHRVHLTRLGEWIAFWTLALGTTLNWLFTQLAAYWGTGRMTPIMGAGYQGAEWQERIVSDGLVAVTIFMLIGAILLLVGLIQKERNL